MGEKKFTYKKPKKIEAQIMAVPLFYFHDLFYLNYLSVVLFEKKDISQQVMFVLVEMV